MKNYLIVPSDSFTSFDKETKNAEEFVLEIKVKELSGQIVDEYNAKINIEMTNGDIIEYSCSTRKRRASDVGAPPYTYSYITIGGLSYDIHDEFYQFDTLVGNILNFYWLQK